MRLLLLFSIIFFLSCSNDKTQEEKANESPRIRKKTSVSSPSINEKYTIGEVIDFKIESKKDIDSIIFEADDKSITKYKTSFTWNAENVNTGEYRFKITVYYEGTKESHFPRVTFFSDITPEDWTYEIKKEYPHEPTSYTQGLFFWENTLYESTGQNGASTLSEIDLSTGKKIKSVNIGSQYFGEGSTYWKDKIVVLTYTSNIGFIYDKNLNQTGTFNYSHQGWGITTYGDTLIVSDGSEVLHFLDPRDLSELGRLEVYNDQGPVKSINELEIIDDILYANIYPTDLIVAIDPKTGKVLKNIDMKGLLSQDELSKLDEVNEVLNGIAYNRHTRKTYVTGKHWPTLFEVAFIKKGDPL